ncbi:arsenate-mycothiol transferase ArsC [Kordiimonas aestuarii]|uniref:arsenate-mycothiol transferase ArsC n=1 Tax=Kordiimonas aestuarii TaxID=1005925 RepID=UPI0021D3B775|nr:low molecular weight phosphatase family protein [Kordiimonas aestuarii]
MTDTAPATPPAKPPAKSVLFVCNQNAVRSPMAEALAKRHSKRRLFVESAGLIAGALDPFTVAAMAEEKIDLSSHKALTIADVDLTAFDVVIALTAESHAHLERQALKNPESLELWAIPDPTDSEGNRNQIMDSYRLVRDHLEVRIADRFPF